MWWTSMEPRWLMKNSIKQPYKALRGLINPFRAIWGPSGRKTTAMTICFVYHVSFTPAATSTTTTTTTATTTTTVTTTTATTSEKDGMLSNLCSFGLYVCYCPLGRIVYSNAVKLCTFLFTRLFLFRYKDGMLQILVVHVSQIGS